MASPLPQGPYSHLKRYEIPLNGRPYGFWTLVSRDNKVAWMPDSEQQHVTFDYNGNRDPVKLSDVSESDIARIIRQILLFQIKKQTPLEEVLREHKLLITRILSDLKMYNASVQTRKSIPLEKIARDAPTIADAQIVYV